MELLKLHNLTKTFDGITAVKNLSFSAGKNRITSLIGPNGAGKTTIFDIISGILNPDEGKVYFKNETITRLKPHLIAKKGISRTFQDIKLFSQMTVLDNLMIAGRYDKGETLWSAMWQSEKMKKEQKKIQEKALETLDFVGLSEKSGSLASELSYGQQKLVEMARALMCGPQLLLLDEPVAGINPRMIEQVIGIIKRLHKQGVTILFIEHNMDVVMDISEFVIVINHGEKVANDTPDKIRKNPKVIEAYLGPKFQYVTQN